MEDIYHLHVNLMKKGTTEPLIGEEYSVRFYDHDIVKDDYLGEAKPDEHGNASVAINKCDFVSSDSPFEQCPDVYFIVEKKGVPVYRSHVFGNLHLDEARNYQVFKGYYYDLGTFEI